VNIKRRGAAVAWSLDIFSQAELNFVATPVRDTHRASDKVRRNRSWLFEKRTT